MRVPMQIRGMMVGTLIAALGMVSQSWAIQIACGLDGVADWGTSMPFKDAMKMCRDWRVVDASSNWDYTHAHLGRTDEGAAISGVSLRPDGYPTQVPSNGKRVLTVAMVGIPAAMYPFGKFTLLFEGTGQVYLGWDAGGPAPSNLVEGSIPTGHGHTVNGTGGATTFEFTIASGSSFFGRFGGSTTRSTGILVHIMQSSASDPVRNLRIILPDPQGGNSYVANHLTQPFNPVFLEDHRPFSVLRFMDWGSTNGSNVVTWSQRMTPTTAYAARTALGGCGVAYEYMADLCNLLRRDMWVNIPHRADANYHTQLARLLRDRLDASRKLYVEYSNETWNGQFPQTGYSSTQASSLGLGTGSYPSWTSSGVYSVYAAVRIWKAFETEFGAGASRLVKVLSGWHINTDFTGAQLWALTNATVNPDRITASAYATAPYIYFSGDLATATPNDVVFTYLNGTSLPQIGQNCRSQRSLITGAGLQFITYEGGQHLLGNETKQRAINTDTRIYNVYRAYIDTLNANGVALLNQFVAVSAWGMYGCWGAKEYAGQPMTAAHKYRALYDYMVTSSQFNPGEPKYWEQVSVIARGGSRGLSPRAPYGHWNAALPTSGQVMFDLCGRSAPRVLANGMGILRLKTSEQASVVKVPTVE